MDATQILEVQIQTLERELANHYASIAVYEAKIDDAKESCGDAKADSEMTQIAENAQASLKFQRHAIKTRERKIAKLKADLETEKVKPKE